jgi:hypothetical protein
MLNHRLGKLFRGIMLFVALVAVIMVSAAPVAADGEGYTTRSRAYYWWNHNRAAGYSKLERSAERLDASYTFFTNRLQKGDIMTLWFIFFENPSACSNYVEGGENSDPCLIPQDVFNDETQADFLWGGGLVVGSRYAETIVGAVAKDDTSVSGRAEIGMPPASGVVGLTDPLNAAVYLALHSHGPLVPGQSFKDHMTSFTGAGTCIFQATDFNGFAQGFGDIPDDPEECVTFHVSYHAPAE